MDKREFKKAWREFRQQIRERQSVLRWNKGMSGNYSTEAGRGIYLGAGFTQDHRSTGAVRLSNIAGPASWLLALTGRDTYTTKTYRREVVKFARQSGRIPLPLEART